MTKLRPAKKHDPMPVLDMQSLGIWVQPLHSNRTVTRGEVIAYVRMAIQFRELYLRDKKWYRRFWRWVRRKNRKIPANGG